MLIRPLWIANPPHWVELCDDQSTVISTEGLGAGESSAIELALRLSADLVLMDDRRGVRLAVQKGLFVTGTMGLLARAAGKGMLDLPAAFEKLRQTNFRYRPEIMSALLNEVAGIKGEKRT